jgi:putative ABC transport system permease protein
LLRSFQALLAVNPGMNMRNLLTMEYRLPPNKYKTPESRAGFHRELVERVSQVPGVVSAAMIRSLPFSGNWGQVNFVVPGGAMPEKGKEPSAFQNTISPGYFSTAGIPLMRGRDFSDADTAASPPVVIVSKAFADRYFGGQDAVGRTIQLVAPDPSYNGRRLTIIGVVGNAKQQSLRDTDEAEIYAPIPQDPGIFGTLVVRTAVDPMSMAEPIRQAVWSLDKDQPVWKVRTLEFLVERDVEGDRFLMLLMVGFGMLALGLSALGTYGVLSNAVNQRQQEIGVRMALGAQPGSLRRLIMGRGLKLTLIGGAIGLTAAAILSRLLTGVLYGISTLDVAAYAVGWATMTAIALLASYLPARLATRVDPVKALRCE